MYKIVLSLMLLLLLVGCKPDPDDTTASNNDNQEESNNNKINKVELGAVSGSTVVISTIDGKNELFSTTTDENGYYSINIGILKANLESLSIYPKYLFIYATGGEDIDPEDDGDNSNSDSITLDGTVKGIFKTKILLENNGVSINLLTTAINELLIGKEKIDDEQISYILKELNFKDINGDGKIDNQDIYEYSMVDNESKLEDNLRNNYLAYIHNGDKEKLKKLTEEMRKKYNLMFINYKIVKGTAYVDIEKSNNNKNIFYALNPKQGDSIDKKYSNSIPLNKNEYIVYKECGNSNCSTIQIASFDGKKLHQSFLEISNFSIFTDLSYMNNLRNTIIQKSKNLNNIKISISKKENEIKGLNNDIDSLNNDIDKIKNKFKDRVL